MTQEAVFLFSGLQHELSRSHIFKGMFSLVNNSHILSVVFVEIKDAFSFECHKF